ncbi:hypothetical protein lbkm_0729 [Lachnospiraceae bacterium KM106-2]|nr:hypothetical protein lbkm_0729 [Lachnospiraceae bacterium KM106-2]
MKKENSKLIKEINEGKNLEVALPAFSTKLCDSYNEISLLQLGMNYYSLHDSVMEHKVEEETVVEVMDEIHHFIKKIFVEHKMMEEREELIENLDSLRNTIIEHMELLTMYTDQFQLYEYILNRKELEYEKNYEVKDEDKFADQLIQFIFSFKDQYLVNEYIKETIGQLPVRMTKAKFFELLSDSISIYKDNDKSALDTYVYMLKTSAGLYHPKGEGECFGELYNYAKELQEADYSELSEGEYKQLIGVVHEGAAIIEEVVNIYLLCQDVVNRIYAYVLTAPYANVEKSSKEQYLDLILSVFAYYDDAVESNQSPEDILVSLEGKQEELVAEYQYLEAVLDTIKEDQMKVVDSIMQRSVFECLFTCSKLLSNSSFIELTEKEEQVADNAVIESTKQEMISLLSDKFKSGSRLVNRAVMAATLSKMPVFFNTSQEVGEYIKTSLTNCSNQAEKQTAIHLLDGIMNDYLNWNK